MVRVGARRPAGRPEEPVVWRFGRGLPGAARDGVLDPVIGREGEMTRLIQIFLRKTKNNPVLIGRSGVGKTAIVEGLALRIVEGAVPSGLIGKRLVALDLAQMVAGSSFHGEFERRLKEAINLIASSQGEFLLMVDELHMIVGAGGGQGGMDVGNMLKPMLARGELRMIGASTPEEYRQHIEKDAALERRFQARFVDPPAAVDTVEILRGLRERHEAYHGVRIHDSALEAAAHLSDRYVTGRHLPDKAVDLIDEAASRLRIGIDSTPPKLDQANRRARTLQIQLHALAASEGDEEEKAAQQGQLEGDLAAVRAEADGLAAQWQAETQAIEAIHQVKQELTAKRTAALRAEHTGDLPGAADLSYVQIPDLERRLDAAVKALDDLPTGHPTIKSEVDDEEIAAVVSAWTGVPLKRLMEGEAAKLLHMEEMMRLRVVGQDDAVRAVAGPI